MNPVINLAELNTLLENVGGDKEFLAELMDTFFEDAPKQIAAMRQAFQANHSDDLRRAAHSLKSTSKNMGASQLATLCLELETLARENKIGGADAYIRKIETAYAEAKQALLDFRANA